MHMCSLSSLSSLFLTLCDFQIAFQEDRRQPKHGLLMFFGRIRNFEVQGMCWAIRESLVNLSTTVALWSFVVRWSLILKDANEHTALRSSKLGTLIRLTYWTWDQSLQNLDSHRPLSGSRQRFTSGKLRKKSLVGDIAQGVNYLPHKCKDLSSNVQNSCETWYSSILLSRAPLVRRERETEYSLEAQRSTELQIDPAQTRTSSWGSLPTLSLTHQIYMCIYQIHAYTHTSYTHIYGHIF